ncbi:MFS transporter [Arthrobacter bussei]|uniref:MFS transporter n=1 Tax=Arthrobacter bussei TaxID=2594179 RepID=A0A7X1NLI0_9MICC|nr:MFS transporter [Arthrobacter bussei]MPY09149.1 MFS transporter [Arthrobacter bussei]
MCVSQTTSWGLLYYSLPVALVPISADTGWSVPALTAAFSAGLIVSALAGVRVGRMLDQRGPRLLMTAGSIIGVLALLLVSGAPNFAVFAAAWLVAGFAQAAVFYQPAFVVLTRWYGTHRVRALTTLTLVAGFASTIFAPITAALIDGLGWRTAYITLAGILAIVTIPLHWFFLNAHWTSGPVSPVQGEPAQDVRAVVRSAPFRFLQATMALSTLALYAVTFNLIALFLERGVDYQTAAVAFGLIGVGQVIGRVAYSALPSRTSAVRRTVVLTAAGAASVWGLALVPGPTGLLVVVAVLAGMVRGCNTLLQATAVSERWGTRNFGSLQGVFAAPVTIVGALAPAAGPALATVLGGYPIMGVVMAVLATIGVVTATRTRTRTTA